MSDKIRIKYTINTGYVGDMPQYFKVDKEDWEEMTDDEKEEYVDEEIKNNLSYDWSVA